MSDWCPSDKRVRCVNCDYLAENNGYTFCGNEDGPIGHVNFLDVSDLAEVWCAGFKPQDWLGKQLTLPRDGTVVDAALPVQRSTDAVVRA